MDGTRIEPALTPEEWKSKAIWLDSYGGIEAALTPDGMISIEDNDYYAGFTRYAERRHALAALALYGQPFGFTREDVDDLRDCARLVNGDYADSYIAGTDESAARLRAIADRLEAMLPPAPRDGA